MVFRHLTKITPTVELCRSNNQTSKITVYLYKDISSNAFKPVTELCIQELQTNINHFMKIEELFPDRKGEISIYLSVSFNPK